MKDAEARVAEAEGLVREAAAEKERERQALLDGQKGEEEERVRAAQRQAQEEEALRKKAEEKVCVWGVGSSLLLVPAVVVLEVFGGRACYVAVAHRALVLPLVHPGCSLRASVAFRAGAVAACLDPLAVHRCNRCAPLAPCASFYLFYLAVFWVFDLQAAESEARAEELATELAQSQQV